MALSLFTSTSISTKTSTTKTPTTNGEMEDDIYFILLIDTSTKFTTTLNGKDFDDVQPVTCQRVDFDTWSTAGKRQGKGRQLHDGRRKLTWMELVAWGREKWVGRRINDEVEMFEDGMGKEYAELRKDLKRHGLTVRPYVTSPEAAPSKFPLPSYKAVSGEGENTVMACCMRTLQVAISTTICDGKPLTNGLIADLPSSRAKTLAILRVPDDMMDFNTVTVDAMMGAEKVVMKVIGKIEDGEPKFRIENEEIKEYFHSSGRFREGPGARVVDLLGEREKQERERVKKRKKEAKKHRRNATASTVAATSMGSETQIRGETPEFAGVEEIDEEERRASKREKEKKKRKAQAEKRRAMAAEGRRVAQGVVELIRHQEEESTKNADAEKETDSDLRCITLDRNRPLLWFLQKRDDDDEEKKAKAEEVPKDDDRVSSLSDSSFESVIDGESMPRLEVLQCSSMEDYKKAIVERPNRNIIVARLDDGVGLGLDYAGNSV